MATTFSVRKAQKKQAKLKLATVGPSKSGKTFGALELATGFVEEMGGRILFIDTEYGRGELYADIFDYDYANIEAPFEVEKFIDAISFAESEGYTVLVLDSLTHMWTGEGGLLDLQNRIAKRTGNSYTAWKDVTPLYEDFIDKLSSAKIHLIATMRSKVEHIITEDGGKMQVKKLGMKAVQREGMDYEFDMLFNLDRDSHEAKVEARAFGGEISGMDGKLILPSRDLGKKLCKWLNEGAAPDPVKKEELKKEKAEETKKEKKQKKEETNTEELF
jgi:hypothetical protein